MKIEIFTFCEGASVDSAGKLSLLAGFDRIWPTSLPCNFSSYVAVRLRFDQSELGTHVFKISFVDSDGKDAMPPMEQKMPVESLPNELSGIVVTKLHFQGRLSRYEDYSLMLSIDGHPTASIPLHVRNPAQK